MATYIYHCPICDEDHEVERNAKPLKGWKPGDPVADEPPEACPACGADMAKRPAAHARDKSWGNWNTRLQGAKR